MSEWDLEEFTLDLAIGRPVYWMHEVSGRMKRIVDKFLKDQPLSDWELRIMRWYIYQWVFAMPTRPDDFNTVLSMSQEDLHRYLHDVLIKRYAIDPF